MKAIQWSVRVSSVVLFALALTAPLFGQSVVANSAWNGGTGPWNSPVNWTTNGVSGVVIPNNGNQVLCNVDQACSGFFNVTIGSGGNDLVTLDTLPVTIDSLTLGAATGNAALDIGSAVADTLTIGDPTAPNGGAAASLTVNSTGFLNVFAGSKLNLNIAAGNGTVTNNGAINLQAASGTGSSLLINDAGSTHQLTLSGTGTLTLENGSVIQGVSGDEFLDNNSTIQGTGTISNLFINNTGTIDANNSGTLTIIANPNPTTFAGLGAHNGTGLSNGGGGKLEASAGSTLVLDTTHSTLTEAPILNNGGVIQVDGGGTLEVIGPANHTTFIGNSNGAQINVGNTGSGGTLELDGTKAEFDLTTVGGGPGTLTLSNNSNNVITGVTGTETLFNGAGETLSGAGNIGNLGLVNDGIIVPTSTSNELFIAPSASGFTNAGTVNVNSGFLVLDPTASATAGTNGLTNSGTIGVADGDMFFEDFSTSPTTLTLLNNGAINVGASLGGEVEFDGAQDTFDFTGAGSINLSDNSNNLVTGFLGSETVITTTPAAMSS